MHNPAFAREKLSKQSKLLLDFLFLEAHSNFSFLTAATMPVSSIQSPQISKNTDASQPAHNPHRVPHLGQNLPRKAAPNLPPHADLILTQHLSLLPPARTPNIRPYTLHPPQRLQPRNQKPTRALQQRLGKRRASKHLRGSKTSA